MHVPEMFSDHGMFMFLYALMEMAANAIRIILDTLATLFSSTRRGAYTTVAFFVNEARFTQI